jgi:hypothetical protein
MELKRGPENRPRAITHADFQNLLALLPVAGAELIGLQGVEHAQDFLRVAADREVVHRNETDDVLRVHDEGGALCDSFVRIEYPKGRRQLTFDVGQHREGEIFQVVVVGAPGVVHELRVGAAAENLGVTVLEFLVELAEGGDLRGAHEGEILRPEEVNLPLVFVRFVRNRLESLALVQTHGRLQRKGRELLSNS